MKNKFFILGVLVVLFFSLTLSACTKPELKINQSAEVTVAATIFPLYDILRQVGGEKVEAILLLPPGSSPHTFEITPSQVKSLQKADFLLTIGANLDDWALSLADNAPQAQTISLDEVVFLRPFAEHEEDEHEEDEDEHEHGDFDPHYWLSPSNARLIAVYLATILGEFNPENNDYYQARAQDFIASLTEKESQWLAQLDALENRNLLVFHDAWYYFAEYFDLNIVGSFEAFPGKSPSPQYLVSLQTKIRDNQVKAIFIEPQLSSEVASALANDLAIKISTLDPLGGGSGRNSYIELLEYNVATIVDALSDY